MSTHVLGHLISINHVIGWGKVSQWVHPKPWLILTHTCFHILAHVIGQMINGSLKEQLQSLHQFLLELKKLLEETSPDAFLSELDYDELDD